MGFLQNVDTFQANGHEFWSDDTFTLALVGADGDPETTPAQLAGLLGRDDSPCEGCGVERPLHEEGCVRR
jgi:hypothetical protein